MEKSTKERRLGIINVLTVETEYIKMSLLLLTKFEIFLKKKVVSNIIPQTTTTTKKNSPASTASARCTRGSHGCVRVG